MKRHYCVSTQSDQVSTSPPREATPILPMDKQPSSVKTSGSLADPVPSKEPVFKLRMHPKGIKRKKKGGKIPA